MTLKVIGFKEYVYICISLHSVGLKVLIKGTNNKKKEKRPIVLPWAFCSFEALYLTRVKMPPVPNITELSTFAYKEVVSA